ncbi:non-ribosomal peptide synthetase [Gordonia insulae]|uniref:Plipastatin synthase subunit B n=1 Tax=Gordonia insulae TaxID=2420509 RepID=A0A3G8JIF7_9ACTN|nr:non-ribosomal peptide synthetase [Gordonia insulae]AZG44375.1 Plipastatin synthase subunit B [Gordonia insulae]
MTAAPGEAIEDVLPLTPLQEAIVYHSTRPRGAGETDPYLILADLDLLPLVGDVDADRLRQAIGIVMDRHAALRTSYTRRRTGQPVARVHATVDVPLSVVRLDATTDLTALHRRERAAGVALTAPPPLRFVLASASDSTGPITTLVMIAHHVAVDGWSIHRVLDEIVRAYRGDHLPPVRPLSDFFGWLSTRTGDTAAWTAALAGLSAPTLVDVPESTGTSQVTDHHFDVARSARLRAVARDAGATVNTLIQVGWALTLAELDDVDDVVFGAVVSGRNPAVTGVDEMVGMLINTIPVRIRLRPTESVTTLLARVQREQLALLDHHHTALGDIQSAKGIGELFNSVVVFESFPRGSVRPRIEDENTYPATLLVEDEPEIRLLLERRGVDATVLDRLVRHLESIVDRPGEVVGRIGRTDHGITQSVAQPVQPYQSVATRIAATAAAHGRRAAVVAGERRLGYRELDTAAGRFAAALARRGVGPESIVAIRLRRTVDMVVVLLAVARTGAAYLPVDPGYPDDRVRFMLADAMPDLIVDDTVLDALIDETVSDPATLPPVDVDPASAGYLVYTSGSTGTPKGVVGTAGALANRIGWAAARWKGTIVLAKSSIAFIDGTTEIFGALAAGATVVLADDATSRDAVALAQLALDSGVDQITAVPALARAVVEGATRPLHTARWIVSGEPLPLPVAERLRVDTDELINSYGSSEVAGDVAMGPVGVEVEVHAGHPVPGVALRVLDRHLQPVPPGVPGELYVAGVQVGRGYHGHPEWTATSFVADIAGDGGRMYRTGDRARRRADGRLILLGRSDAQVKIRGNRVELGEVESALLSVDGVTGAAVVAGTGSDGDARLDAYVAGSAATRDVTAAIGRLLPTYMMPATWTRLEAIPMTPGGKLDRRGLPAPDRPRAGHRRPPSTELERDVVAAVADVLGVADAGLDDDFFDLGGHSLSATRVLTRLRVSSGVALTVAQVFDHPVLADIVGLIDDARRDEQSATSTPAPSDEPVALAIRPDPIPLSPAQRRLEFQSGIDDSAYTVPFAVRLQGTGAGAADADRLRVSLRGVVRRHEALRTRIVGGAQVIDPPERAESIDIPDHDATDDGLSTAMATLIARPFDLTADLPIRADLLRIHADGTGESDNPTSDAVLLVTVHHIAADEWSAGRLFAELADGYNGVEVPTPTIQFADHTIWQLGRLGDPADPASRVHRQIAFWRRTLADAPDELDLPYDRPRELERDNRGDEIVATVGPARLAALRDRARHENASMFMLVHSAVAVALSASGAGNDVVLGAPIAGRAAAATDELIGMFVNTLTLRTDLSGNPDLSEVVARVRRGDLDAYANQDVPFDAVVAALAPDRSLARHPLFQTMVQYRDPIVAPVFDDLRATPEFPRTSTAKFDLTFEFAELADDLGIRFRLEYATELFDRHTATALSDRVVTLLGLIADAPTTRLADLRLAGGPAATLSDPALSDSAVPVPDGPPRSLVDIVAATVAIAGDRTAVIAGAERLTYREIDHRSARLATRLIADGVVPGDFVALLVSRSTDLVVAVLATLRAGAAYVPIDPDYPADRVSGILDDARPRLIVDDRYLASGSGDATSPHSVVWPTVGPDHPAYVIFTSGSTGRPKGVTVSHRNVVALLDATAGLFEFGSDDVWTMFHSYAFDFSVWELWGPLSTGASVVIPDRATTRSPEELGALIAAENVTVLNQTPSAFFALDAVDGAGTSTPGTALAAFDLSSLRYVIFGGEALDLGRLDGFLTRHPRVRAVNMYGITEITVHASHLAIDADIASRAQGSDVGTLLPGFRGHLLDQYLRPVPTGAHGELYLAGPQLATGYLRRAGLTATRFVADPYHPGAVLYRTGDVLRHTADGRLLYVGRSDAQVKIRGFRIELGEVRAALAALENVRDVAVIARPGPDGADRLLAYVVGDGIDSAAIRVALIERLPDHLVPAAIVVLDRIPLTVNGKTDVAALPDPELSGGGSRRPAAGMELALAEVFADSLGIDRDTDGIPALGVDDDFFSLGGDSIVSTTMVNRARRRGLQLTPRDVFTHRTIAGLATVARWADQDRVVTPGGAAGTSTSRAVPLLPIVHRLRELGGTIDRFNQSLVVDTPVGTDRASLAAALQALLDGHDALRTGLSVVAGVVWSIEAHPVGSVRAADVLDVVALSGYDDTAMAVHVESDRAAARLAPSAGIMLAATFLEPTAGETGRLILVIHHLAVDGVSRRIILDDLAAFHEAAVAGITPVALPEGTTLPAFAGTVAARAADPAVLAEAQHWATVLAPGGELIPGTPPAGGRVGDQRHHVVTPEPDVTTRILTDVPGRLGVGITALFLGAFRVAAGAVLGTGDLIVDTERHGRDTDRAGLGDLDLSHTVGWFTTVAPLRLPPAVDLTTAVLDAERLWDEMPSAGAGFGMLRYLNPQLWGALAGMSRASVLMNYLGRFPVGGGIAWQPAAESTALNAVPDPDLGCGYPLEIDIVCRDETTGPVLSATFTHLPDQLSTDTVHDLAEAWRTALESLSAPIDSGAHA